MAAIAEADWMPKVDVPTLKTRIILVESVPWPRSLSFGVMHLGIAFGVAYALTGSVAIAGAITFVEPLVNTVAHYFFDKYWGHPRAVAWLRSFRRGAPGQRAPALVYARTDTR